jgi:carbon dioxide concentrating mechanism protein CcmN
MPSSIHHNALLTWPPQNVTFEAAHVSGNVTIDPSAAIAPGCIFQAAPDCEIRIESGVCVGMGVIVQAYGGTIVIESGVMLGSGVLIVGACAIHRHACLGVATTVFNASVEEFLIVPAGSILGDTSRQIDLNAMTSQIPSPHQGFGVSNFSGANVTGTRFKVPSNGFVAYGPSRDQNQASSSPKASEELSTQETEELPTREPIAAPEPQEIPIAKEQPQAPSPEPGSPVFGQTYVNQLLVTIFPQKQS